MKNLESVMGRRPGRQSWNPPRADGGRPSARGGAKPITQGLKSIRSTAAATRIWHRAQADTDIGATMKEIREGVAVDEMDASLTRIRAARNPAGYPLPERWKLRSATGAFLSGLMLTPPLPNAYAGSRVRRDAGAQAAIAAGAASIVYPSSAATAAVATTANAVAATAAPLSATSTSAADTAPFIESGAPPPASGWIDAIEWRAFDEVAFLTACGVHVDDRAGLPGRLRAMHECFPQRAGSGKLPLDIAQFDEHRLERFADGVLQANGYGQAAHGASDPAYLQTLFSRWFLQLAAPEAGDGNGGHRAPFDQALLRLAHPDASQRRMCRPAGHPAPASWLPRIGALKDELRRHYLKSYERFDAGPSRSWAFEGLCQLFEPTLVRNDLPDAFRYGSLSWALLAIGIGLAGDAHVDLSLHELIALAAAAEVFDGPVLQSAHGEHAMQAILRMAHAQGKIDLLDRRGLTQNDVEIALRLFRSQLLDERKKLPPLERMIARLPTRGDIAKDMLREAGIDDPERRLAVAGSRLVISGKVFAERRRTPSCMADLNEYPLYRYS
ncbi:MAG: hypothetical protein JWP38_3445 [Herbaspirillum sp.]|nr:hypothetical protein [Herbaspirillum sp.]